MNKNLELLQSGVVEIDEAARLLGKIDRKTGKMKTQTLRNWCVLENKDPEEFKRRGLPPSHKSGGRRVWYVKDLMDHLNRDTSKSAS